MDNSPRSPSASGAAPEWRQRLQAAWREAGRLLRRYVDWLAAQSWKRLALLALLATIVTAILSSLPPFNVRWGGDPVVVHRPHPPKPPRAKAPPHAERGLEVQIDEHGVRIRPRGAAAAASAASAAASAASAAASAVDAAASAAGVISVEGIPLPPDVKLPDIDIKLPPGADKEEVRRAIEEARDEIRNAVEEAKAAAEEAAEEARNVTVRDEGFRPADHMMSILMLVIVASIIAKVMGTGRKRAEAQAAVATERAEEESLKRQVVEARMAAMQAQVEPHFLFNTLASIDHLIETEPGRASQMQKNLIALLRAAMPTMREANATGLRELRRELEVIRPYLEILKVRMEERLQFEIDVPEGLHSAEFPPMMIQSLVENAIKHGLEPKAEGGRLTVKAEIRHGKLVVTVADTGLGFGKAATAGTGVGLANIRERLQLLYGGKATLTITENHPSGTVVAITVPYTHRSDEGVNP
ncbi:MAG: histidine kinase [Pseudomonadota bacterium]